MKISLKRSKIPVKEKQFQELLAAGLIKKEKSAENELRRNLGLKLNDDPKETPRYKVDKSVIIELLKQAKFKPIRASSIKMCGGSHLVNYNSDTAPVSETGIYIKDFFGLFTVEIGFYFESQNMVALHKSLNFAFVNNSFGKESKTVYIPFFVTQRNETKDQYEFSYLNMDDFSRWLYENFTHCKNIPSAINNLLQEYSKITKDSPQKEINESEVEKALAHVSAQFPLRQKHEASGADMESDNCEEQLNPFAM